MTFNAAFLLGAFADSNLTAYELKSQRVQKTLTTEAKQQEPFYIDKKHFNYVEEENEKKELCITFNKSLGRSLWYISKLICGNLAMYIVLERHQEFKNSHNLSTQLP